MSEPIDKMRKLEDTVTEIHLRMKNMDRGVRWHDSLLRRLIVLAVSYVVSIGLMLILKVENFWLYALIPVIPLAVDMLTELILRKRWSR